MVFLKRTLLSAGVFFLMTLLFIIPPVFAVTGVLGSTASIEQALGKSGIYDEFVPLVLENAQKQNNDPQAQTLLAEPAVQSAIQSAFPPQTLRTSATAIISGVFGWLQGKTAEPEFSIDLSESKQALISNLNAYAEQRINALPVCTVAQLQTINPNADILSLPCRPPGASTAQLSSQFSDQLAQNTPFLDKPVITNKTLAKEGAQPLTGDIAQLPQAYQATQTGRWLLVGLVILVAGMLVLLRRNKRAGIRLVGWSLLVAAGLWAIICLAYLAFIDKLTPSQLNNSDSVQVMVTNGVQSLLGDVGKGILLWVVLYAVVGAGALLALRFWPRTSARQPSNKSEAVPDVDPSPTTPKTSPEEPLKDTQTATIDPKPHNT